MTEALPSTVPGFAAARRGSVHPLSAAAIAATPLLAQTGDKPAQTAATEGCAMGGEHGNREARHAQMQAHMQTMHAQMGSHEGRGPRQGEHSEHQR